MTTEHLVLKALIEKLETEPTAAFKLVDVYLGQYEDADGNPLYDAPCALVELRNIDWQPFTDGLQVGLLQFAVHVVDDTGYDDKKMRLETAHFEHCKSAYQCLNGQIVKISDVSNLPNDDILMNTIQRKTTNFDNHLRETVATVLMFESWIVDYSGSDLWDLIVVDLEVRSLVNYLELAEL